MLQRLFSEYKIYYNSVKLITFFILEKDMPNSSNIDIYDADLFSGITAFDTKNFTMAYQLLAPLATKGNAEALWRVGMMQMNGLGMVENQPLGFENLLQAASQDHAFAHHMLGVAYMTGEGVEKDITKSIEWFEKGAEFGIPGPMYTLGMLYEDGKEVKEDLEKAQYWFDRADKINL